MKIKKAAAGFLALAACLALSACGEVTYTFTFSSGGEAALIETTEGETPDPALAPSAPEGERIVCYLDASGAEADPFAAPAEAYSEMNLPSLSAWAVSTVTLVKPKKLLSNTLDSTTRPFSS